MSGRLLIARVQLKQTELVAARRIVEFCFIVGWWDEDEILEVWNFFFLSWCTEHMYLLRRC